MVGTEFLSWLLLNFSIFIVHNNMRNKESSEIYHNIVYYFVQCFDTYKSVICFYIIDPKTLDTFLNYS